MANFDDEYDESAPAPGAADLMGALVDQVQGLQQERDYAALVNAIPELGERPGAEAAWQASEGFAQALGAPHLAGHPVMLGLAHRAGEANAAAQAAAAPRPGETAETFFGDTGGGRRALPFG